MNPPTLKGPATMPKPTPPAPRPTIAPAPVHRDIAGFLAFAVANGGELFVDGIDAVADSTASDVFANVDALPERIGCLLHLACCLETLAAYAGTDDAQRRGYLRSVLAVQQTAGLAWLDVAGDAQRIIVEPLQAFADELRQRARGTR